MPKEKTPRKQPPKSGMQRVNLDFPIEIVQRLDEQAAKRGMSRQGVIKFVIHEWLEAASHTAPFNEAMEAAAIIEKGD